VLRNNGLLPTFLSAVLETTSVHPRLSSCALAQHLFTARRIFHPAPAPHPQQVQPASPRKAVGVPAPAPQMRVPATRAGSPAPRRTLLSRACMEHFISCIHTTLTSVEVQSCLERQVVVRIVSPTNLLEVIPYFQNSTKKAQAKERFEHCFSERDLAIPMSKSFSNREFQHRVTVLWPQLS